MKSTAPWMSLLRNATPYNRNDGIQYYLEEEKIAEEEARKAKEASRALFSGVGDDSNMPTTILPESDIPDQGIYVLELMTACKLVSSKEEARRLLQQGGVSIDGKRLIQFNGWLGKRCFIK